MSIITPKLHYKRKDFLTIAAVAKANGRPPEVWIVQESTKLAKAELAKLEQKPARAK